MYVCMYVESESVCVCVCVFDGVHSCTRMIVFSSDMALRNMATKFAPCFSYQVRFGFMTC